MTRLVTGRRPSVQRAAGPGGNGPGRIGGESSGPGGYGLGGGTLIDIQDLTKQLGEQAAQSLVDWSQGKLAAAPN